jgi:hypothetical protein
LTAPPGDVASLLERLDGTRMVVLTHERDGHGAGHAVEDGQAGHGGSGAVATVGAGDSNPLGHGAFGDRDAGRGRALIAAVAEVTGPYFRYEEAMYPQLTGIFGDTYAGKLLADQDGAIRDARELQRLAGHDELTEEQAGRGAELIRQILPHVSDSDGLTIMVETMPDDAADRILPARKAAQEADLLTWAATARERRA